MAFAPEIFRNIGREAARIGNLYAVVKDMYLDHCALFCVISMDQCIYNSLF